MSLIPSEIQKKGGYIFRSNNAGSCSSTTIGGIQKIFGVDKEPILKFQKIKENSPKIGFACGARAENVFFFFLKYLLYVLIVCEYQFSVTHIH